MNLTKERRQEIIRFCVVGGLSFLIDYGLLYFCTETLGINYLYSAAISFSGSVIINYWLCLKFVFSKIASQNFKQVAIFMGSSVIGLGINQLCMWFLVEKLGLYYMMAKIIATGVVMIWNYIMKRKAVTG